MLSTAMRVERLENRQLLSVATLASFPVGSPPQAITVDSAGNLFGTTSKGGPADAGSIWELPKGSHSVKTLYNFAGNSDGDGPLSIAVDGEDNLYGTALNADSTQGLGVWELPHGASSLTGLGFGIDDGAGNRPTGITIDSAGNLFGTTHDGSDVDPYSGTIWGITTAAITTGSGATDLYSFGTGTDNNNVPVYVLGAAVDQSDNVYVVSTGSGNDEGTLDELANGAASPTTLYSFPGEPTVVAPSGGIAVDRAGDVFGSALSYVWELPQGSNSLVTIASLPPGHTPLGIAIGSDGDLFGIDYGLGTPRGSIFEIRNAAKTGGTTAAGNGSLSATFGNVNLPPQVTAGEKINARIPVVVSNSGASYKGAVAISLYANTSATLDGNQTQLLTQSMNVSILAGKSKTFAFVIKSLPTTLDDGTYYILADAVGSSGNPSVAATLQTVTVSAPTWSLVPVTGTVTAAGGGNARVNVTIMNQGNSPATGGASQITLFSSPDGISEDTQLMQSSTSLRLGPNKSETLHVRLSAQEQAGAASDGYVLVDVTDPADNDQILGIADNAPTGGVGGGGGGSGDLVLLRTDLPHTLPIQQDITVDDTFVYHGGDYDDVSVDYYISTSKGLGGAVDLGSADLGPLSAGEIAYGSADLSTGNISVVGGDAHYYILWVDDNTGTVFASRLVNFD